MTYLSRAIYPGVSGSQQDFGVSFGYLDLSHVHVYARNVSTGSLTEYPSSGYTWTSSSLIHFLVAPPAGLTIEIWRITPKASLLTRLAAASVFVSSKVNAMATQLLYLQQEETDAQSDITTRALQVPVNETAPGVPSLIGKVGRLLMIASVGTLAWVTPVEAGLLAKGDPGANVMSTGSFASLSAQNIPVGTATIWTSEYRVGGGRGGARYRFKSLGSLAADQAYATAHPTWARLTANSLLYVLDEEQQVVIEMFGAYGDASNDDYPAWLGYKDYADTLKEVHGNSYYKAVPALFLGRHQYRTSHHWDLTDGAYKLRGSGPSVIDRGGNTFLLLDAGICGFVLQSWDTTGVTGTTTNTPKGSAGASIEDIAVYGQGGTVGAEEHGFLLKAPATLVRCYAYEMGGYGFLIAADVTHAGNANCGLMIGCGANRCGKSGLGSMGGDSNAWGIFHFNAVYCMEWGIEEQSFLGNHYNGWHLATNGTLASGPSWAAPSTRKTAGVNYSGHYYRVRPTQATWCSTNAPSGTTTTNQGWQYLADGAATAAYPAWVSGINAVFGGAFLISGASTKASPGAGYMESDQTQGYCNSGKVAATAFGFSAWDMVPGTGNYIGANDGRIVIPMLGTAGNNGDGIELRGDQIQIGPQCYFQRTSTEGFDLRGTLGSTLSMTRNIGAHQHPWSMSFAAGTILGADSGGFTGIATAMPTTGTYTQGAWVRNRTPAVSGGKALLGWLRLTTGSAHVAGTDWTPMYGTTT